MNSSRGNHCLSALLLGLLLSACSTTSEQPEHGDAEMVLEASPAGVERDSREHLPQTDEEVMYRVFAGEVLGADGDLEKAAVEYLAAALESDDPEVAKRATQVALAAQTWQHAAMAADRWAVLAPTDLEALEAAARSMLLAGDYVGAEHYLSSLLTVMQDEPMEAWSTVAVVLSSAMHPEQTGRVLQHLIEDHGAEDNPFALFARSQVAARAGDLESAMALAAQAAEGAPDRPELHAWAGRVAMNMGDQVTAIAYYHAAWSLDPTDRVHALLYAELLRQAGSTDKAEEVLANLPDTPDIRFTRIAFALQSQQREKAEALYHGFETADYPDDIERAEQAARSAELLEWPEEAIRWYERIESGEKGLVALGRRAYLLSDLGRLDEARQVLLEARLGASPEIQIETIILESQILIEADQSEESFRVLDAALQDFPEDVRLLYTRALVAVELDRLEVAETDLQRVIEQDPQNAAALNALGYTLADRTERYEEAERLISAAYRIDPEAASIIDSMGWVAYRQGRFEEAAAYLQQAFTRDRNAEIAAHLGEVLWMMGRQDDARAVWALGQGIDPENKVLIATLDRFGIGP